jgi:RNA polymerase sigma factor (TIGR02999 family)
MSEQSEAITVDTLRNLFGELRIMARQLLTTESNRHSFTPTALAVTALLRVKLKHQDWENVRWENRAHFFNAVTRAMRNALIDHARRRRAKGRNNVIYLPPDEICFHDLPAEAEAWPERLILIEEAIAELSEADQRLADVLYQYYYAGYSIAEMAHFQAVSEKTVDRELNRARTVLRNIMEEKIATG